MSQARAEEHASILILQIETAETVSTTMQGIDEAHVLLGEGRLSPAMKFALLETVANAEAGL